MKSLWDFFLDVMTFIQSVFIDYLSGEGGFLILVMDLTSAQWAILEQGHPTSKV